MACQGGYMAIVGKLLQNKADMTKCSSDYQSPLYMACQGGYADIMEILL